MRTVKRENLRSVRQVADEMGMTSANVHYHIGKWRTLSVTVDGTILVDIVKFRKKMASVVTRGKPRVGFRQDQAAAA